MARHGGGSRGSLRSQRYGERRPTGCGPDGTHAGGTGERGGGRTRRDGRGVRRLGAPVRGWAVRGLAGARSSRSHRRQQPSRQCGRPHVHGVRLGGGAPGGTAALAHPPGGWAGEAGRACRGARARSAGAALQLRLACRGAGWSELFRGGARARAQAVQRRRRAGMGQSLADSDGGPRASLRGRSRIGESEVHGRAARPGARTGRSRVCSGQSGSGRRDETPAGVRRSRRAGPAGRCARRRSRLRRPERTDLHDPSSRSAVERRCRSWMPSRRS